MIGFGSNKNGCRDENDIASKLQFQKSPLNEGLEAEFFWPPSSEISLNFLVCFIVVILDSCFQASVSGWTVGSKELRPLIFISFCFVFGIPFICFQPPSPSV